MERRLAVVAILMAIASPVHATRWNPAIELEAGAGQRTLDERQSPGETALRRPSMGFGVTAGSSPDARTALRAGVCFRRTITASRLDWASTPGFEYREVVRANELRLPVRLAWAPRGGRFAIEGGATGVYVLGATSEIEVDGTLFDGARPASPEAIIFMPFAGEQDVTDLMRRGNVAATLGVRWGAHFGGRATALSARYEHGLLNVTTATGHDERSRAVLVGASMYW
ncbi:MAG: hypothetical protein HZA61_16895 [Candidatus Eisenbacteria bacterium]|uniref:PorT family protein n=1 Tax=Eiseniibacteriota bacterium TaxID=2212470 RepID=A0A933SEL8_UNCEI|nr:hypothetical protein [Candidatus Eisenbacteria bacterium]